MRAQKIITLFLLIGGILLAGTSCTREEPLIPSREGQELVPVNISFSVAKMQAGTPETKAVMEPEIPGGETLENQVHNFVVLQFEGAAGNEKLIGYPEFYDAAKVFEEEEQVRLIPSSQNNVIVVIANTFNNIYARSGMTLEQFLNDDFTRLEDYASVLTKVGDKEFLRMSGAANASGGIGTDEPIEIVLKRNVSKITVNVTNNMSGTDQVTLHNVQLRDINAKYYYLTNIDGFKDGYTPSDPCRIDKEPDAWEGGTSQTFTYYVPANLRGTTDSDAQYTKALGAPEGSTRFCLYGTYGSDNTAINYTYYLGENLKNDFNLKPNYHYTYNITLNSKGDARYDYRIEDCKDVVFKMDANSYIVQPPIGKDQFRIYAIPIRRAAVFWNSETSSSMNTVYGAKSVPGIDYSSYSLGSGSKWTADILWSDFKMDNPADFFEKATGTGYDPANEEHDPFFKIKVREGMKGNVVIAVRPEGSSSILWSWHIWITDYNPDRENLTKTGSFVYDVDGGHVHRYGENFTNAYENGFIMDRNLGASGPSYEESMGTMYYQFGRKDPFPVLAQDGTMGKVYKGGSDLIEITGADYYKAMNNTKETDNRNVRYSVCNPMVFLTGTAAWTKEDALVDVDGHLWFDPKSDLHTTPYDSNLEANKSLYDPCPPGWKIPVKDIYMDIQAEGSASTKGISYKEKIFYPAISFLHSEDRSLANSAMGIVGYYWTATTNDAANSTEFVFNTSTNNDINIRPIAQATAKPVRCVREYEYIEENYRQ